MNKTRFLFIIHDIYQNDNEIPLGPAYLASVLEKNGYYAKIYSMDVFHYTNNQLAQFLQETTWNYICLGFLAARYNETVIPLCKIIQENKKDALFVLGGHGPSPIPEYILKNTGADIVVIGEGESQILNLAEGKLLEEIPGIAWKQGNGIVINNRAKLIDNIDSLPFPAWHLFPMKEYSECSLYPGQSPFEKAMSLITARGCIANCSFCYRMDKGIRTRSVENVIEEILALYNQYNITYFNFQEDLTFLNKERIFELAEAFTKLPFKMKFGCNIRVDLLTNSEVTKCLKEMGCMLANVGFESMDKRVLSSMHKRTSPEQNIQAAENCTESGLAFNINMLWNHPYDTIGTLKENTRFVMQYNNSPVIRTIRPITPYPGCELYYLAIKEGIISGPEEFFSCFKNSDLISINFMNITTESAHRALFKANINLIREFYKKRSNDLISSFRRLYFNNDYSFRGARHYAR